MDSMNKSTPNSEKSNHRMGDYLKNSVGKCVKVDQIVNIAFNRKYWNSIGLIQTWLSNRNIDINVIVPKSSSFVVGVKRIIGIPKYIDFELGVCIKTVKALIPQSIVFDKEIYDSDEIITWMNTHSYNIAKKIETDNTITYIQFDYELCETQTKKEQMVDDGIQYILYDRKNTDGKEATSMKQTDIMERPKLVYSHVELKAVEQKGSGNELIIEGFASTGEIDRDLDIVDHAAFKTTLSSFMDNPVLCYMHNWMEPIGKVIDVKIVKPNEELMFGNKSIKQPTGGLFIRASISKTEEKIGEKIKENILKAFSIGFMIKDAVFDEKLEVRRITDLELFEVSVVSIPSNRQSLFSLAKALKHGTDIIGDNDKDTVTNQIAVSKDSTLFRNKLIEQMHEKKMCLKNMSSDELVKTVKALVETKAENEKVEYTGTTGSESSDATTSHTHEYKIYVERDENGQITSVDGLAAMNQDHEHPIRELNATEIVDNHKHEYVINLDQASDPESTQDQEGDSTQENPEDKSYNESKTLIEHENLKKYCESKKDFRPITKGGTIDDFIGVPSHIQKHIGFSFRRFKIALAIKSFFEVLVNEKYKIEKIINLGYRGELVRCEYAYLQTGREKKEELLIEGFVFTKNEDGVPIVFQLYTIYSGINIGTYYKDTCTDNVIEFFNTHKRWMADHNFYKNETLDVEGKFLPIVKYEFDDVKLPEDKKQSIKVSTLDFFNKKDMYIKNNLPFKRGMIFAGEPGTGKTLTGKILMSKSDVTFIWATARDLIYPSDIEYIFDMAKELSPCIIFAEDIDNYVTSSSCIDIIKTQMDGLESMDGLVTILCTNFPHNIPKALIDRPSRFDDVIKFELPDESLRFDILKIHSVNMVIDNRDESLKVIAKDSDGLTGSHLKELIIYAMLLSVDNNRENIMIEDLKKSLKKIMGIRIEYGSKAETKMKDMYATMKSKSHISKSLNEKIYNVPQDIMNDIIDTMVKDNVDSDTLLKIMEFLIDLLENNTEEAVCKYLLKSVNESLDASIVMSDDDIAEKLTKLINENFID